MTAPYRRRPRFINGIEMPREADLRTEFGRRLTLLIRAYSAELGGNLAEADKACLGMNQGVPRLEQLCPKRVFLSGEVPLEWTSCRSGGKITPWDRLRDRSAPTAGPT
jgi:hypothetical protein